MVVENLQELVISFHPVYLREAVSFEMPWDIVQFHLMKTEKTTRKNVSEL